MFLTHQIVLLFRYLLNLVGQQINRLLSTQHCWAHKGSLASSPCFFRADIKTLVTCCVLIPRYTSLAAQRHDINNSSLPNTWWMGSMRLQSSHKLLHSSPQLLKDSASSFPPTGRRLCRRVSANQCETANDDNSFQSRHCFRTTGWTSWQGMPVTHHCC